MTQDQIIETVLGFIAAGDATEDSFNGLALDLFAYQFENNLPFRRFSMQRERTPRSANGRRAPSGRGATSLRCRSTRSRIFH